MKLSRTLKVRIYERRADGVRLQDIAAQAGISRTAFSMMLNGRLVLRPNDRRALALAKLLGVPASRAFERVRD